MTELKLKAEKREKLGGLTAKRMVKSGYLPAVVYGPEKKNLEVVVPYSEFVRIFREAGENTIVKLEIDGKEIPTFIHDASKNPLTNQVVHVDFYQFSDKHKFTTDVPLKFVGESRAVKELAAVLTKDIDHIEIECLPEDMIHEVIVDLSSLNEINDIIYISDLKISDKVKVLDSQDQVVVSVKAMKEEVVEETKEAPTEEAKPAEAKTDSGSKE